jgi:hypothetical protein
MSTAKCQVFIPQLNDWEIKDLTVGHVFELNCEGEWPKLDLPSLELRTGLEDKNILKLIEFKAVSESLASLKVVSYVVGDHKLQAVQLVDQENSVLLGDLQFTVASVQDPKEPVQEPLPPAGPFFLQLHWIYFALLFALLALIGTTILIRWQKKRNRKRLMEELHLNDTAATAYNEFYKSMRHIQRKYHFLNNTNDDVEKIQTAVLDVDESFKRFLSRRFQTPALKWSDSATLSDIRRFHKSFYKAEGAQLKKVLLEFSRKSWRAKIHDQLPQP